MKIVTRRDWSCKGVTAERSDGHLLLDARKAQWVNTISSVYVEQSDWIKKGRYDSWQHVVLARPSPTRSKIFYRIWRPFTHGTKVPRIATAEEKVLPRHSCRWWPYCESVTVVQKTCLLCSASLYSALLCPALPCPNWPLLIVLHGDVAFMRRKNSTIVNSPRELDTQILRKLKSGQKDCPKENASFYRLDIHWWC